MALKLQDLIDIEQFQMLQDRLNEIYAFPSAIIDNDGVILTATAWQEVCTQFHRKNAASLVECIKSDRYIADHLQEANPCVSYRCPHGLIDNATPIIIDGVHYGNFFTGQFFLEPPDMDFFRAQAARYGFPEEAYLAAVRKVPIWNQQQRDSYLFFIKGLIEVISGIGLKNLRESEIREQFRESEARFRAILRTAMDGFLLMDLQGRILESNETYQRMSGYSERELLTMRVTDLDALEQAEQTAAHIERIVATGADRFETRHRHREGHLFDVEVSAQYRPVRAGQLVAFIRDIGEQKRAEAEKTLSRKAAERLAEEMAMLAEIGRVVGATLDIDKVYERVADAVRRLIPCDRFLICRKQPGENEFTIAYAVGRDNAGRRVGDVYPTRGTAFGLAMAKQAGVLIQPESAEEIRDFENLYNTFKTGLRSTLIVPLISLDEVIGSMNIRSCKLKAYSERDLRLAEQIGIQVAGAIANAQRFTELQENRRATERLAQEMATLAEIGRVVGSTPDIQQVYDRFAAVTRQLIPFDTLSVNLLDAPQTHFRIAYFSGTDLPDRTRGLEIATAGSMTGYVVTQRRAVIMKGSSAAEIARRYPGVTQVASIHAGFLSNMLVPLYSSDAMIGVLHFRTRGENAYGDADLRLAERIGMQVAGAIANAQLFTELQQQRKAAERLADEQAAVAEIGRVIGSTPDIEQVYDRFAAITRQLIPFETLSVNLLDASRERIRIAYFSGTDVPGRRKGAEIPIVGSLTSYALKQRKAVIMRASSPEEIARRYPEVTQSASIGTGRLESMLIPLVANDITIGLLHFRARPKAAYSGQDLHLAERVGMQIAGAVASAQLFSDLSQAEKALRESEERFRLAFATSPDAISINRMSDGLYLDVNEGFTRLTGYPREAVIGRTTLEIDIWCDPAGRRKLLQGVQERGYVENLEGEFRRRDGSVAVALMSARILVLQGVPHLLSITRDISDRKRAEEEQAKLREQLLQSQKMESIGRLAGGVAHDFNNMLGVILGHLEMAMDEVGPGHRLFNDLKEIGKAARRSADLTGQLLAFARKQTIAPRALDLNETVEEALKMLRRLMGEDILLAWLPSPGLWPVRMDPSQVDQILANLCVNARDAIDGSGRAGKVTIATRNVTCDAACCAEHSDAVPGDYVCLAVSDNGSGMDGQTLAKLFEPFFTTKPFGKGTGLGLATIYGIIKQNSGFVTVESEPGQGATFRLYLPRHRGPAEEVPEAAPAALKTAPLLQGRETILVVEDEPDLLELTRLMLERQGYRVLTAGTPDEAIRLAEGHSGGIDLLVTDVVMPGMNGRALAERILARHPRIRCLFTSGYTADVIAHHGVLDTGTAFIQKPFSRDALAAKVREVLDRL